MEAFIVLLRSDAIAADNDCHRRQERNEQAAFERGMYHRLLSSAGASLPSKCYAAPSERATGYSTPSHRGVFRFVAAQIETTNVVLSGWKDHPNGSIIVLRSWHCLPPSSTHPSRTRSSRNCLLLKSPPVSSSTSEQSR